MNCAQVKEQLVDFLYEEMPAEARASFAEHLHGCPACRADVASYKRTLGQARAALGGPLAQEPPARVHLAVLAAAKAAAAKPAPAKRSARADEPGFFARLLRTPWLLPAFGAASIATAVFLVRVLKNPEVIPGQQARSIDEPATVAREPMAPSPTAPPPDEYRALAGNKLGEVAGNAGRAPSRTKAGAGKGAAVATAPAPGPAAPALVKKKKSVDSDLLDGLSLGDRGRASGASRRFAEPPPPPNTQGAREKDRDDLLNSATEERTAQQPKAQVAEKPADKKIPTLSLDPFPPTGGRDKVSKITGKQIYPKGEFAEPPPPAAPPTPTNAQRTHASNFASPSSSPAATPAYVPEEAAAALAPKAAHAKPKTDGYAPIGAAAPASTAALPTPSPPAPQAKRARAEMVSDESESESEGAAQGKAGRRSSNASPTLEESAKKADRLYASQDWNAAAEAYRDLLRRFPKHKDASKWRDRMNQSLIAEQERRKVKTPKAAKAAKATSVDDVLDGSKR